MKITSTKLYEYNPEDKLPEKFVTYINQALEQLIRATSGNLSLEDNLKGQKLTLSLTHNQSQTTNVNGSDVVGVIPLKVKTDAGKAEAFANLSWFVDSSGKLVFVPQFKNASVTEAQECTLYILKQ